MRLTAPARRRLLPIVTVVVAVLWAGALLMGLRARPWTALAGTQKGLDTPGAATPVQGAGLGGAVGTNLEAGELTGERAEATLARLEQAGIRWVRFVLPWDQMEPARGEYDWSWSDTVFQDLARHPGLQPLVVLDGSPSWARRPEDAGNPMAPPQERSDFGAFASAVATRYGSLIGYYQIWIEPNIAPHWGARGPDPADYLGLLREGAIQVRAADPGALIVLAGLAPTTESGAANLSDIAYLDALYAQGARGWFDVAASEPYGFSDPPQAAPDPARLSFGRVSLLHDVMLRHGDGASPLWAVAYGWNALPDGWSGPSSPWGQVSEEDQAQYADSALETAASQWGWLGPLFWAADCPERPPDDPWLGFAVCQPDGSMKPVWAALASATQRVPILPPGAHPPNHPALHYGPGWRVTPGGADPGSGGGSLEFAFYGTDLALKVQGGPYWALYRIWVDGQPANALPRDEAGAAYLVLYDPLGETRVVPLVRGLRSGEHRVQLEAEGGWGQWALQGLVVSDAPQSSGRRLALLLLAASVLGTLAWVAIAWSERRGFATWLDRLLALASAAHGPGLWAAAVGLALVAVLSPGPYLPLAALAGLGVVFLLRPDVSLPLIAASITFVAHPLQVLSWRFSPFEMLVWAATAALVLRLLLERLRGKAGGAFTLRGLDWPLLGLLAAGLVATAAAERKDVAMRELRTVFLDGALFYWLVTRAPAARRSPEAPGAVASSWPVLDGLVVGMGLASLLALWQLATGHGRVDVEGVWRVRALYGSPNNLALVLDRAIPLAVSVAAFGKTRRLPYGLIAVIMTAACVATFSKGALLLGLPVGLGLVLLGGAWRTRSRWPVWVALGMLALGGAGLGLLLRTRRFADLLNLQTGTSFTRLKLWQSALRMTLDHPLTGVGPDNFLYAYRTYVLPDAWQELNLSHPHNIILDLWTRTGILGLAAGLWAIVAASIRGWRLFRDGDAVTWPLALGLLAGLAAAVAHGLIDNSLFLVDLMALFVLTLGLFQRWAEE